MTYWWDTKWNKDNICCITHARLRPGFNKNKLPYTVWLQCGHGFYITPLMEWVRKCPKDVASCPCCRHEVTLQDIMDAIVLRHGRQQSNAD